MRQQQRWKNWLWTRSILGIGVICGILAASQLALQANQAGLNGLGQVFGAGNAATFGSLPGLASLLGGPTVLGGGGSMNQTNGILGWLG